MERGALLKARIKGFGLSDKGGRKTNQDSFFCNDKLRFYLVADGIGGHAGGDLASLFTSKRMNAILEGLLEHRRSAALSSKKLDGEEETSVYEETIEKDFFPVMVDGERILRHVLWFTNEELCKLGEERAKKLMREQGMDEDDESGRKGFRMGTTLIAVWFRDDQIIFMNVGDSRAYIIWEGNIQRVTHDHSKVEEVIREGELSPKEARRQYARNVITRCVGIYSDVAADFYTRPLHPGMRILLCSDGLYDVLPAEAILEHGRLPNIELACKELINAAKFSGEKLVAEGRKKSYDNITAVLIDVGGYSVRGGVDEAAGIDEDSIF